MTDSHVQDRPRARPRPRPATRPAPPIAEEGLPESPGVRSGGVPKEKPRLLALVTVLAFATAAFAGHGWYAQRKVATARTQAVVAAGSLAMRFVSISAATVDADLAGVAADASGTFGRDLIRGGANLRAKVLGDKVQATGRLLRAGLVNGDLDAAAVLVAVDAIVRDAHTPDGRSVHYRMRLDLAHESGRWLVTGLRYVS